MRQALLDYLLNVGWQLALVAACAFMLSRLLRLAPAQSHRLWLAAYGLAVLAPAAAMLADALPKHARASSGLAWLAGTPGWHGVVIAPWLALLLGAGFWLCLGYAVLRLIFSNILARRFVAASVPLELPAELRARLETFCRNRGHALPQIRCSPRIVSPVVTGLRAPCVLVPPSLLEKDPDQLLAALLHELAHVVRSDYAANIVVEVLALPLTWHPALHAIKAMIRLTREQSCDAMAAAQIGCRHLYARSLLSLARQAIVPQAGAMLGMFGEGDLRSRIALLAAAARPRRFAGLRTAGAAALVLMLGVAVTAVHLCPVAPSVVVAQPVRSQSVAQITGTRRVALAELARLNGREAGQPARRKRALRARGVTDTVVVINPVPHNTVATVAPADGGGAEGIFDFSLPFEALRYRAIAP